MTQVIEFVEVFDDPHQISSSSCHYWSRDGGEKTGKGAETIYKRNGKEGREGERKKRDHIEKE